MGILQARVLEWVASPPPGGSSWPRDWTQVSLIAGGFFPFIKDGGNHTILEIYWQLQGFFFFIFILNYLRTSHVTYLFSISRYLWVLCKHLITSPWSLAHCNIRWRYNVTTLVAISFWVNDWIVDLKKKMTVVRFIQHKINHLKMSYWVVVSTFSAVRPHLVSKHFHYVKVNLLSVKQFLSIFFPLQCLTSANLCSASMYLSILDILSKCSQVIRDIVFLASLT